MLNKTLLAYKTAAFLAQHLPSKLINKGGDLLARHAPKLDRSRSLIVKANLERSLNRALTESEAAPLIEAVYRSYARYYIDTARLPNLDAYEVVQAVSSEGFHHICESVEAGKGTILVLPHVGGWEWAGSWLARCIGYDVTAVVEPLENVAVRDWMKKWRESVGMHIKAINPKISAELAQVLKDNHVLCLLSDRNVSAGGVEVEFFGEKTVLPAGAATLALRTGARIIPVGVYHRGEMNHVRCLEPIEVQRQGRLRHDVTRITQDIAHKLEELIRAEPTQWIVLQPNWPSDHQRIKELKVTQAFQRLDKNRGPGPGRRKIEGQGPAGYGRICGCDL